MKTGLSNNNWRGGRSVTPSGYVLVRVGKEHHLSDVRGYAYEHRKRTNLRPVHGPNPIVFCACGCGGTFTKYDAANRPRVYLHGHNGHGGAR